MTTENRVHRTASFALCASLCLGTLTLDGCHQGTSATPPSVAASQVGAASLPTPIQAASLPSTYMPVAYALPSADALYEMTAPIALFPDKLLAQVLAASAYPDQVAAADQWLAQNGTLKGQALQSAVDTQAWDPSVKSLTQFHDVLDQMAQNVPWTTALGLAYANDPIDVMNAVQVMRQRASAKGALQSNPKQRVSTVSNTGNTADAPPVMVPAGQPGSVIVPPPQTIVIEPAQSGIVYVPVYNPTIIYGGPLPLYPGYVYAPPAYSEADLVATGLISFGVGVAVGAALDNHYNWGWSAWGVHWNNGYGGGWIAHGGGIVFNGSPWVSHSTTVINHVNNVHVGPNYGPHYGPHFDPNIDRHIINTAPVHRGVPHDRPIDHPALPPVTHANVDGTVHHADLPQHADGQARDHNGNLHPMTPGTAAGNNRAQWRANHPAPVKRTPQVTPQRNPQLTQAAPLRDAARTAPSTDRTLFNGEGSHLGGLGGWQRR